MITSKQVSDFKESYCNENKIIPKLLKDNFETIVEDPILDVGSGLGEISSFAFENKKVIHLDVEDYSKYPIPANHERILGDFFEYKPEIQIQTLLLSHVLQFIDGDIEKLNGKIEEINPKFIIVVRNTNNDFMGQIMEWFNAQNITSNPERIIPDFPRGYKEDKKIEFVAELKCPSFEILAEQVSYLWDVKLSEGQKETLLVFLKEGLSKPKFQIHQEIVLYIKN